MGMPTLAEAFRVREVDEDEGDPRFQGANPLDPSTGKTAPRSFSGGPTAGTAGRYVKPQMSPPDPAKAAAAGKALKPYEGPKPPYPGTYLGQTWTTNSQVQTKPTMWRDKPTGDMRFGRAQSMGKTTLTWNGADWVTDDMFKNQVKSGTLPGRGKK